MRLETIARLLCDEAGTKSHPRTPADSGRGVIFIAEQNSKRKRPHLIVQVTLRRRTHLAADVAPEDAGVAGADERRSGRLGGGLWGWLRSTLCGTRKAGGGKNTSASGGARWAAFNFSKRRYRAGCIVVDIEYARGRSN